VLFVVLLCVLKSLSHTRASSVLLCVQQPLPDVTMAVSQAAHWRVPVLPLLAAALVMIL
jgi:hypothetical protein